MKYIFPFVTVCLLIQTKQVNAQTTAADNVPSKSETRKNIPAGPSLLGVFEGRPPCQEIAKQLKMSNSPDCIKLKWRLTLYHDPNTGKPTTYTMDGNFCREQLCKGKWEIIKGTATDADAIVYKLELDKPGQWFYFLKGDENVLFVLDENKNLRVGNADFSYTLNRVELVPMKPH